MGAELSSHENVSEWSCSYDHGGTAGQGYEIIQFRRPGSQGAATATLRFVNDDGQTLTEWREVTPSVFVPAR